MNSIDSVVIDVLEIRLDSTYIRFESDSWYKYNAALDIYARVKNSSWLEAEYQKTKEERT